VERTLDARVNAAPLSTYRLQFTRRFRFEDARAIVPYLASLGVDCIYASPYLKARPGSEHGYDVVDPNALNPEIGTPAEHAALIDAAKAAGLKHILDFVPNHMGVGGAENPWWQDVLEWGEGSPFADYFDIDWHPTRTEMAGKVLVPFLGDYYGSVLERGELLPAFDPEHGTFAIAYFERRFPLATSCYGELLALAAQRLQGEAWPLRALAAEFDGATRERAAELKAELALVARDPATRDAVASALRTYCVGEDRAAIDRLDALLQRQHYRLSYWRVSADEINYRRFFDVNDLAGLRVEDAAVLAQTHRFVFDLIASRRIDGLRIDHVDGLFDPGGYCRLLQDRATALGHPQYLVVEKILARFESLHSDWLVAGSTGYDFMNLVNGLFVDPKAEAAFDRTYRRFAGIGGTFEQFAYRAKKDIMRTTLASELEVLATMLDRIAGMDRRSNDYTYNVLRDALMEVIASFPVYRTYVTSERVEDDDRTYIGWAVGGARKRSELGDDRVFDFVEAALTAALPAQSANYDRRVVLRFAMKFQQYTSPVMAKAVEDTAFYRYVRLASLNEVGGDPRKFGTSVDTFHRANAARAREHPAGMVATATHDHKRGEDVRTRIDVLSEMPAHWDRTVQRWNRLNVRYKSEVESAPAPTENDEYHLYQVLVGTWPVKWLDRRDPMAPGDVEAYARRIEAYLRKALREAKFRTSWTNPNVAYEDAALSFARAILQPQPNRMPYLRELRELAYECARIGAISSLAQTVLKLTAPGVPDIYQGCEFWDLSLVDPDNRRPVDYAARAAAIEEFGARVAAGDCAALAAELARSWSDGRIKSYVAWRLLHLRRERPNVFLGGSYTALVTSGTSGGSVVAFARDDIVVAAPRLVRNLVDAEKSDRGLPALALKDARIALDGQTARRFAHRFTGETIVASEESAGPYLDAADLFARFPVAVLEALD